MLWVQSALTLLLETLERSATDVLPADMGGRGRLLHLLGEAAMPTGLEGLSLDTDTIGANFGCESDLSLMKRALRRAPRAFSLWVLGPFMCARNGVFEELAQFPALAEALWDWVSLVRSVSVSIRKAERHAMRRQLAHHVRAVGGSWSACVDS